MLLLLFLVTTLITSPETSIIDPEIKELIEVCIGEEPTVKNFSTTTTDSSLDNNSEIQENIDILVSQDGPTQECTTIIATDQAPEANSIIITNAIEPNMLAYKHWTGTYSPEIFTITIDGTSIAQGEQYKVPVATSIIQIRYDYSFMGGMRTGAKIISYQLHENITASRNLTFSWKESCKVLIDHATFIKEEVV